METMREEEHASFVAEEKELAEAVATVDAALAQLGNATLVQRALNLRKVASHRIASQPLLSYRKR